MHILFREAASLSWISDPVPKDDSSGHTYLTRILLELRPLTSIDPHLKQVEIKLFLTARIYLFLLLKFAWLCLARSASKPCCVYIHRMLSPLPSLKKFCVWSVNHGIYTCGSVSVRWPPFVVREGITCTSAVELSYYFCKCFNNDKYQTVLSICSYCESNGKKPITRGEYKDGAIRQRRQVKRESMAG